MFRPENNNKNKIHELVNPAWKQLEILNLRKCNFVSLLSYMALTLFCKSRLSVPMDDINIRS